jgi:hypothetical protein
VLLRKIRHKETSNKGKEKTKAKIIKKYLKWYLASWKNYKKYKQQNVSKNIPKSKQENSMNNILMSFYNFLNKKII